MDRDLRKFIRAQRDLFRGMPIRTVTADHTAFALRLAKHVASGVDGQGNVVVSPVSIHVALALLAAGAKDKTLDEIVSLLVGCDGAAADLHALTTEIITYVLAHGICAGVNDPAVSCSNGVFVDASLTLKPSFKEMVTDEYKSETNALDFQNKSDEVLRRINSWVEEATSGLIRGLLPPGSVDEVTRFVLVNALYFKGAWEDEFDPSKTRDSEFHLLDGSTVQAPFMTSGRDQYVYSYDGFKVLRLPYRRNSVNYRDARMFSMYIFLPDARDGIWSLQERLIAEPEFLSRHVRRSGRLLEDKGSVPVGEFKLPKFKISFGLEASAVLKDLGVVSAFNAADADFSEMVKSSSGRLGVDALIHKSFIQVDEVGTEAASATAVFWDRCVNCMRREPPVDFVADHPFIFLLKDDCHKVIVFAGHVTNPLL